MALFLFCVFGFVGVLPDLDHTAHYLATREAVTTTTFGGRDFHIPIFVAAWLVFIYIGAHVVRLSILVLVPQKREMKDLFPNLVENPPKPPIKLSTEELLKGLKRI